MQVCLESVPLRHLPRHAAYVLLPVVVNADQPRRRHALVVPAQSYCCINLIVISGCNLQGLLSKTKALLATCRRCIMALSIRDNQGEVSQDRQSQPVKGDTTPVLPMA